MALIRCPECGREVSDKAAACPNCAAPIKGADEVRISTSIKGAYPGVQKVAVYDCSSNSVLWKGRYTYTCVIKIQKPTEIYVYYHGLPKRVTKGLRKVVEPGKRYAATVYKGAFFAQYNLVEVDVIDSD